MKRLVLLGGGHAQVQVVEAFASDPPSDTAVALVNRSRLTPYSGMLPGLIAGHYTREACHIDLAWLCAQANIAFVEREAIGLDLERREVHCAGGHSEHYDLLSIDTGSTPPLDPVPGARQHALPVKPIESFLPHAEALTDRCADGGEHSVVLVGGGAAGFEVILALVHRATRKMSERSRGRVAFHWVTDSHVVLPAFSERVRRSALRSMEHWHVQVHTNARVERVTASAVEVSGGQRIRATDVIWATGAAAPPMYANAGLATDAHGFIAVDSTLRSISHPKVFASGDAATMIDHPRPKAGVFAVRQGPPLARNLRQVLAGGEPQPCVPQKRYLAILSAGERYAIATRGCFRVEGRWVWTWKDHIDRRFVARFQPG